MSDDEPISDEEMLGYQIAVDRIEGWIEQLLTIMKSCPYEDFNDRVAALGGLLETSPATEEGKTSIGIVAMMMLERERARQNH